MSTTAGLTAFAVLVLLALVAALWSERREQRRRDAAARTAALEREARRNARPTVSVPPRFRTRTDVEGALASMKRTTSGDLPVARGEVTAPGGHTPAPGPRGKQ